jgi:hypothetical protein
MDPALAAEVQRVILHDGRFSELVKNNNTNRFGDEAALRENFTMAVGFAQSNRRALSKAQKVRPVRSSSGALGTALGRGGLDSAIANALKDY